MNFKKWLWYAHKDILLALSVVFVLSTLGLATGNPSDALIGYAVFCIIGAVSFFQIKKHWKKLEKDENGNLKK